MLKYELYFNTSDIIDVIEEFKNTNGIFYIININNNHTVIIPQQVLEEYKNR
jgi:hypothetical protein